MYQFVNLPQLGTLTLEHTFYEYGEPVLFVCTDQSENRYLCSCCRLSEEWLIAQIHLNDLIDIIDDRLAFSEIFRSRNSALFFLTWDGHSFGLSNDVPADAYPDEDSYLELSVDSTAEYRSLLEACGRNHLDRQNNQYCADLEIAGSLFMLEPISLSNFGACQNAKDGHHPLVVKIHTSVTFEASLCGEVRARTLTERLHISCTSTPYKVSDAMVAEQTLQAQKAEQAVPFREILTRAA